MKKIIFLTVVVWFTLSMPVVGWAADKTAGEAIYKKNCAGCHGQLGSGDGPAAVTLKPRPTNFIAPHYKDSTGKNPKEYSDAELSEIVEYGRKGTAMPKWKKLLNHDEIADVVDYIRSL